MRKFSLVSTVFNESKRLAQTIEDLDKQTLLPDEIIITDAGSNDGTYEMLQEWSKQSAFPIIILLKKKCNVAEGRNLAIRNASYSLIVSTDFGCRFHPHWLETLVSPFENPEIMVVGGGFAVLEEDLITVASRAAYIMSGGYKIDVYAPWFIPSSRSIAYHKEVFDAIGGYCEWLTLAADDLVFGKEIKARGYAIHMEAAPRVYWGRHDSRIGYIKEAFRYGLGDGEARVNQRSFISNLIEFFFRVCLGITLAITTVLTISGIITWWWILSSLIFLPGLRSYYNYTRNWLSLKSKKYNTKVFLYGFILLEKTRWSYLKGYKQGFLDSTPYQKQEAKALQERLSTISKATL